MAIDKIFNDANVDGIADNIFGAVNNSVSEVKQMQQRKAAENVQMVVEAFKKIETNITEKFDNVTDVIEKRVLTIKDGRDGSSGSDGRNGRDGKPGRDGVNGKQGTPGTPGKDGVDGEDGVSVTNANIDFDGSLVISLSTGQQINVGEVVAPDLAEKIKIVSTMSTNGAVGIKDEGSSISTGVKNINFVGAAVTATNSGDDVTVNVSSGTGTVTSVAATVPAFLSVAGSPVTTTGTLAISLSGTALPVANGGTGLTTGTSGGVLAYTAAGTLASSTALAANALVVGGGAGVAPSTTTTGTGVVTALGVNTGTAGAFVVNGGALGTPSSGTVTNLTGTASININGTVGATTASTGAFTTVTASGLSTFSTSIRAVGMTDTALTGAGNQAGFMLVSSGDYMGMRSNTIHDLIIESYTKSEALKIANTTGLVTMAYGAAVTGDITASTGNIVIGTAGKGIDFSATASGSGTMTSELLADYEEGTWTPVAASVTVNSGTPVYSGTYTKIGRIVYITMAQSGGNITLTGGGTSNFSGLPFTVASALTSNALWSDGSAKTGTVYAYEGGTIIYILEAISSFANLTTLRISATYSV